MDAKSAAASAPLAQDYSKYMGISHQYTKKDRVFSTWCWKPELTGRPGLDE